MRLRVFVELQLHHGDVVIRREDDVIRDVRVFDNLFALVHSLLEFGVAHVPQRVPKLVRSYQQLALGPWIPPVVQVHVVELGLELPDRGHLLVGPAQKVGESLLRIHKVRQRERTLLAHGREALVHTLEVGGLRAAPLLVDGIRESQRHGHDGHGLLLLGLDGSLAVVGSVLAVGGGLPLALLSLLRRVGVQRGDLLGGRSLGGSLGALDVSLDVLTRRLGRLERFTGGYRRSLSRLARSLGSLPRLGHGLRARRGIRRGFDGRVSLLDSLGGLGQRLIRGGGGGLSLDELRSDSLGGFFGEERESRRVLGLGVPLGLRGRICALLSLGRRGAHELLGLDLSLAQVQEFLGARGDHGVGLVGGGGGGLRRRGGGGGGLGSLLDHLGGSLGGEHALHHAGEGVGHLLHVAGGVQTDAQAGEFLEPVLVLLHAGSPLLHALVHPSLLRGHEVLESLDETGLVLGGWIVLQVVDLAGHGVDPAPHGASRRGLRVGLRRKLEHDDRVQAAYKRRRRLGRNLVLPHGRDDGHAPAHELLARGVQTGERLLQRGRLLVTVGKAVDDEPPLAVLSVQGSPPLGHSRRVRLLGSLERSLVVVTLGDHRERGRRGRREGPDRHGDESRDDVGGDRLAGAVGGERDGAKLNLARPGRGRGLLGWLGRVVV